MHAHPFVCYVCSFRAADLLLYLRDWPRGASNPAQSCRAWLLMKLPHMQCFRLVLSHRHTPVCPSCLPVCWAAIPQLVSVLWCVSLLVFYVLPLCLNHLSGCPHRSRLKLHAALLRQPLPPATPLPFYPLHPPSPIPLFPCSFPHRELRTPPKTRCDGTQAQTSVVLNSPSSCGRSSGCVHGRAFHKNLPSSSCDEMRLLLTKE
jgi:hypothetical protein